MLLAAMRWTVLLWAALAAAQAPAPRGTGPKPRAADYPAHTQAGQLAIGAEYMVHSFSGSGQTFVAEKFLVVEVALYPPRGATITVQAGHFALRVNGKKQAILAQAPGFVAASLKYPDWEYRPRLEGYGGAGNAGVILGRPAPTERFPGDPNARNRLPAPPRAPEPDNPSGADRPPQVTADEVAVESSLPEGPSRGPVSGYLYFPYTGKTRSIKSLELDYTGPEGEAALKLR